MEIWKNIEGYPNYQVSNFGNVRSLNYHREGESKILKTSLNHKGYQLVSLYKNNKRKTFQVHRLVAQAFIQNPDNLPQVNHKDENKQNNCVDNLEWCDVKYNCNYGSRNQKVIKNLNHKTMLGKFGKDNPSSKPINQYDLDGSFIRSWDCAYEVKRELGFSQQNICSCLKGRYKTANGFIWKYAS